MWLAVLIAELLPRFDVVMGIIGGTLTGPLIFILPPLFYQKMTNLEAMYYQEMERIQSRDPVASDDREPLFPSAYGSIVKPSASVKRSLPTVHWIGDCFSFCCDCFNRFCRFLYSDCILSGAVIMFGIGATLISTYYNIFDVRDIGTQFWGSCAANVTLLSEL